MAALCLGCVCLLISGQLGVGYTEGGGRRMIDFGGKLAAKSAGANRRAHLGSALDALRRLRWRWSRNSGKTRHQVRGARRYIREPLLCF